MSGTVAIAVGALVAGQPMHHHRWRRVVPHIFAIGKKNRVVDLPLPFFLSSNMAFTATCKTTTKHKHKHKRHKINLFSGLFKSRVYYSRWLDYREMGLLRSRDQLWGAGSRRFALSTERDGIANNGGG